jgi:Protein of unknown function (DUF2501)
MLKPVMLTLALGCAMQPASAQMSAAPIPSALPNVSAISAGNAAGVLQYCVAKNLVSSTSANAVLDGLNKKPEVTKSADYTAGASGQILGSKSFSIGSAPSFLQSQACDMVLKQAKTIP